MRVLQFLIMFCTSESSGGSSGTGTNGPVDLGGGREMWAGFTTAAKVGGNWKPLLNVYGKVTNGRK